jgi:response regulator RpfG family c-di-GMP phosphodiesterase
METDDVRTETAKNAFERLPTGTETVLVVDDDNNVRALIRETLKMKGYHVLEAQFNSGALMASGRHRGPIHLMIADVMMPGINGRELGRRLELLRPDMRILYISGYPKEVLLDENILEERSFFLQKPVSPETLLPKVREILDATGSSHQSTDNENDEFVLNMLQSLLNRKKDYDLSKEQTAKLESLLIEYEEARLACEAEFMVAELHIQTLAQNDQTPAAEIEAALRNSERAQTTARLEGLKALQTAEAILSQEQRQKMVAAYPHGRRRVGDPMRPL